MEPTSPLPCIQEPANKSYSKPVKSSSNIFILSRSILILLSYLRLGILRFPFTSRFPKNILHTFANLSVRTACPDLITPIIFYETCKL
jgi:hypothetical protein